MLRSTTATFPALLGLVETMLITPTFSNSELKRISTIIRNELHAKQEQSAVLAREQLRNSFYDHTDRRYTADSASIISALKEINKKSITAFHQTVRASHLTCSILGTKAAINRFEKLLKMVKKNHPCIEHIGSHALLLPQEQFVSKNIPSKSNIDLSIGTPIPITIHHVDYIPVVFALGVLGIPGFAGRLMSTVRDKEGLTYSIYAYAESFSGTEQGYMRILTFFTPLNAPAGLTSTYREIHSFFKKGISPAEFETFQTIFKTKQALLQDSPLKQLADLHTFNVNGFSVDEIQQFKARLRTTTRAQVNAVIKKYFDPKSFVVSAAGPIAAIEKDIKSLLKSIA